MDFCNTDPMFGSAVFQDVISINSGLHSSNHVGNPGITMAVMDFDSYSRPTMMEPTDMDLGVDSPTSEPYCESDDATSIMGFQDSVASPSDMDEDSKQSIVKCEQYINTKFIQDRNLIQQRYAPHEVFPANNSWTLEQKAAKLLELSPCKKYTVADILNIPNIEKPETRVQILIEIVCKIIVHFRWNFVKPQELYKAYTVVTNCKKEKEKKDADGNPIPKRPMNAFMIWCQKCRTLMAHICPQLHNAIISKALGAVWKTFTAEERAVYEDEKIKLMSFHNYEFPDYKYRPKKKPKKSEEKPTPAPKSRSKKKQLAAKPTPSPLRGINIADEARQNLDPLLKERLQVKMQVKIDPDLKRGIGKRATGIDLADLTGFQTDIIPSSLSPEGVHHQFVQNQTSSVFDTPENSPHEPRTPDLEHNGSVFAKEGAFRFDEKVSLNLDNNNKTTTVNHNLNPLDVKTDIHDLNPDFYAGLVNNTSDQQIDNFYIKSEPISPPVSVSSNHNNSEILDFIKSEPTLDLSALCYNGESNLHNPHDMSAMKLDYTMNSIKMEPGFQPTEMPILSADFVTSVLPEDSFTPSETLTEEQGRGMNMNVLLNFITTSDDANSLLA